MDYPGGIRGPNENIRSFISKPRRNTRNVTKDIIVNIAHYLTGLYSTVNCKYSQEIIYLAPRDYKFVERTNGCQQHL